jgi:putative inorganic carbon (HCO3(-)) transporter
LPTPISVEPSSVVPAGRGGTVAVYISYLLFFGTIAAATLSHTWLGFESDLLLALGGGAGALTMLMSRKPDNLPLDTAEKWGLLYILTATVSAIGSVQPSSSLRVLQVSFILFAYYWLMRRLGSKARQIGLAVICVTAFAVAAYGFYTFSLLTDILKARMNSTLLNPNILAGYLVMAGTAFFAVWLSRPLRPFGWPALIGLVFCNVCLVLTSSRAGWVAWSIAMAAVLLTLWRNRRPGSLYMRFIAAILCSFVATSLYFGSMTGFKSFGWTVVGGRVQTLGSVNEIDRSGWRTYYWRDAIRIGLDHPLTGTGPDTFRQMLKSYMSGKEYSVYTHSNILEAFSETGFPGVITFILWLIAPLAAVLSAKGKKGEGPSDIASQVVACGCLGLLLHSAVDFDWSAAPVSATFFVLMACVQPVQSAGISGGTGAGGRLVKGVIAAMLLFSLVSASASVISKHFFADGEEHARQGDLEGARRAFRSSTFLAPLSDESYAYLASTEMALLHDSHRPPADMSGLRTSARLHAERVLKLNRMSPEAWYFLANSYENLGLHAKASQTARKALALFPDNLSTHAYLVKLKKLAKGS